MMDMATSCTTVPLSSAFHGAILPALPAVSTVRRSDRAATVCKDRRCYGVSSRMENGRWSYKCSLESSITRFSRSRSALICAAQLPRGVEAPSEEPSLPVSAWGFTETAEVWNSRVAMIGLLGLILLEFIAGKGILQILGVEVGKGLDLPL